MQVVKKSETYLFDQEKQLKEVILKNQKAGWLVENMGSIVLRELDEKLTVTIQYRHESFLEVVKSQ